MSKNVIKVEFANEKGVFDVNTGAVFKDEFSETLDSASIIVSKLPTRINVKPNDEVRVFCNNFIFDGYKEKYYLVDSVYCKEISLNNAKTYQYTIELKSLTGYLDLIQLPNRTLNHSLVSGQKKIIDYIEQFVDLYVPRIKMTIDGTTWKYQPLIEVDDSNEFIGKFSVPCRDLSFTQPTLRQVLTTLMLQVGCLPKITKLGGTNILTFLDLRKKPEPFAIDDNSANYTTYSIASDSYVNTLVNMNDNVLDDENVVITENIGFRDTSQVLLKQKENLFLTTTYPIYDVQNLKVKVPVFKSYIKVLSPFVDVVGYENILLAENYNGVVKVGLFSSAPDLTNNIFATCSNIVFSNDTKIYRFDKNSDGSAKYGTTQIFDIENYNCELNAVLLSNTDDDHLYVLMGKVSYTINSTGQRVYEQPIVMFDDIDEVQIKFYYIFEYDISKLCVEENKRKLLNTNFTEIADVESIDDLAKYTYTTVGYEIGANKITGFSSTYSYAVAWWSVNTTYIEAIINKIISFNSTQEINKEFHNKYFPELPDFMVMQMGDFVKYDQNQVFTSLMFEITYKPLNTFRFNHIKEEEQCYRLEQLDTSENAITNFDDVLEVEQQKVNRLGNEVVVKNQRTLYHQEINNVNTIFDDYIVFSREVAVGIEDFKVNYTASKNYVLQNYFTAIQTKYRAYEYVNYGQSVVRKENTTIFAKIGRDYYDGDDNIYFGVKESGATNKHLENIFLSGAINDYNADYNYKVFGNGAKTPFRLFKSDLSILVGKNTIAFNTQAFDSVSYGVRVNSSSEYNGNVGGLPQEWYIKGDEDFTTMSAVLLGSDEINNSIATESKQELLNVIGDVYNLPLIKNPDYTNALWLVDNNKKDVLIQGRTYYLDKQELLNQTIQFDFYTDDDGILWTEKLWKLCWFVSKEKAKGKKYYYLPSDDEEFGINKTSYTTIDTSKLQEMTFDSYETKFENGALVIRWADIRNGLKWLKIIYEENGVYYDLLALKNTNNLNKESFYITLNDTKTDRVACLKFNETLNDFRGIIAFNEYVVEKNTLNRSILKV